MQQFHSPEQLLVALQNQQQQQQGAPEVRFHLNHPNAAGRPVRGSVVIHALSEPYPVSFYEGTHTTPVEYRSFQEFTQDENVAPAVASPWRCSISLVDTPAFRAQYRDTSCLLLTYYSDGEQYRRWHQSVTTWQPYWTVMRVEEQLAESGRCVNSWHEILLVLDEYVDTVLSSPPLERTDSVIKAGNRVYFQVTAVVAGLSNPRDLAIYFREWSRDRFHFANHACEENLRQIVALCTFHDAFYHFFYNVQYHVQEFLLETIRRELRIQLLQWKEFPLFLAHLFLRQQGGPQLLEDGDASQHVPLLNERGIEQVANALLRIVLKDSVDWHCETCTRDSVCSVCKEISRRRQIVRCATNDIVLAKLAHSFRSQYGSVLRHPTDDDEDHDAGGFALPSKLASHLARFTALAERCRLNLEYYEGLGSHRNTIFHVPLLRLEIDETLTPFVTGATPGEEFVKQFSALCKGSTDTLNISPAVTLAQVAAILEKHDIRDLVDRELGELRAFLLLAQPPTSSSCAALPKKICELLVIFASVATKPLEAVMSSVFCSMLDGCHIPDVDLKSSTLCFVMTTTQAISVVNHLRFQIQKFDELMNTLNDNTVNPSGDSIISKCGLDWEQIHSSLRLWWIRCLRRTAHHPVVACAVARYVWDAADGGGGGDAEDSLLLSLLECFLHNETLHSVLSSLIASHLLRAISASSYLLRQRVFERVEYLTRVFKEDVMFLRRAHAMLSDIEKGAMDDDGGGSTPCDNVPSASATVLRIRDDTLLSPCSSSTSNVVRHRLSPPVVLTQSLWTDHIAIRGEEGTRLHSSRPLETLQRQFELWYGEKHRNSRVLLWVHNPLYQWAEVRLTDHVHTTKILARAPLVADLLDLISPAVMENNNNDSFEQHVTTLRAHHQLQLSRDRIIGKRNGQFVIAPLHLLKRQYDLRVQKEDDTSSSSLLQPCVSSSPAREKVIHASVVRVMKSRRTLDHHTLFDATTALVENRFFLTRQEFKQCVEELIDKEYLKRDENDAETYQYVA